MKFEFVPWTSYADRFLNELNSKGSASISSGILPRVAEGASTTA
jgi:hypothetical protein